MYTEFWWETSNLNDHFKTEKRMGG